jgi:hypothetical protein
MGTAYRLLRLALAVIGALMILLYPLAEVWPSGWAWHDGAPHESQYFMMIVGLYVTLGAFLLRASAEPRAHLSLIWFAVWSSAVHGVVMAVQALGDRHHRGHLVGDVPALLLAAAVLAVLVVWSGIGRSPGGPMESDQAMR